MEEERGGEDVGGRNGMRKEGRWEVSGNERERERERKRDSSYLNGDMSMKMEE